MTDTNVTADELRQFIERMESHAAEKKQLAEHEKETMAEAVSRGFDKQAIREILKIRAANPDDLAQREAMLDAYKTALGM